MSALFSLFFFIFLAAGSLITVSIINTKEKKKRFIRHRVAQMKQQVEELEELVMEIDQLVVSRSIAQLINDEIIEMLEAMIELDESATYLEASLNSAKDRSTHLFDETTERHIDRLKESDAQIAKSQKHIENGAKIVRQQQSRGRINLQEMTALIEELSWTHLMIDAVSYTGQGHKATNRHDPLTGHAFYKKAQQVLMQSANPDKRRHKLIRELTDILSGHRRSLSTDIMWEDHYNPKEKEPPTEAEPQDITAEDTAGESQETSKSSGDSSHDGE